MAGEEHDFVFLRGSSLAATVKLKLDEHVPNRA
jgi:hypothetical protein